MENPYIAVRVVEAEEVEVTSRRVRMWAEETWRLNETLQRRDREEHLKEDCWNQQVEGGGQSNRDQKLTKNSSSRKLKEKNAMNGCNVN